MTGISNDGNGYLSELSDGTLVRGRALLVATGVQWRRLFAPGIDALLGDGRLREVVIGSDEETSERIPADALFVCIGGIPRTEAARPFRRW